jgi:ABC-type multidrug transport system ATPase subunit
MELSIQKLSKSFNQKVVFSNLNFDIPPGSRLAITGSNGSGKSTLLKIISGGAIPSSGQIYYKHNGNAIQEDQVYKWVHFVAPYNTIIEELTLPELFHFHKDLDTLPGFFKV